MPDPKMNGNKYTVTVGINPESIPGYKDDIQKQLNTLSKDLSISPKLNDKVLKEQIAGLHKVIDDLKSEQLVNVQIDAKTIESQLDTIAVSVRNKLAGIFDFGGVGNSFVTESAKALNEADESYKSIKRVFDEVKAAYNNLSRPVELATATIKKFDATVSDKNAVDNTKNLVKRLRDLGDALHSFQAVDAAANPLQNALDNIDDIINKLSTSLNDHPLNFNIQIPNNEWSKKQIKDSVTALNDSIARDADLAIEIKATPKFLVTKDGEIKPIKIPSEIDSDKLRKSVKDEIQALNNNPNLIGKLKIKIDEDYLKSQVRESVEQSIRLNIVNTDLVKLQLEEIEQLSTKVQTKLNKISNKTITSKSKQDIKSEAISKVELSPSVLVPLSDAIGGIDNKLQSIVEKLGIIQTEGIKASESVKDVANETAKQTSKSKGVSIKEESKEISKRNKALESAKSAMNEYLAVKKKLDSSTHGTETYKHYQKEADALKAVYENAKQAISAKEDIDELNRIFKSKDNKNTRDINEKRAKDLDKIKTFAKNAQIAVSALDKDMRLMEQKARNTDVFGSESYSAYIKNMREMRALLYQMQSAVDSDNIDVEGLKLLNQRYNELYASTKAYDSIITELNSKLSMTDKNMDKLDNTAKELSRYMNEYGSRIKRNSDLYAKFIELQDLVFNQKIGNNEASRRLNKLTMEARAAGIEVENLWTRLRKTFGTRLRSEFAGEGWLLISMSMRQIYQNVLQLDTAMTELKKVTNETEDAYIQFLDNAEKRAKRLGATLVDTVSATSDFARLGYGIEDASHLADAALIYLNVADGVDNIETASSTLVSTMQGLGIAASDVMTIIDKFNEVANNFASSAGDIGEITRRSAAAMKVAGSTLDETIALGVTANEVVQDADTIGTAIKTMSMRLRSSKSDLEAAGEDTEGMADSVSKLRDEIKALTGVDIMLDDSTYKTPYQMLMEIGAIWDHLSDASRANVGELLFGKRQANVGFAILENYERAQEILKTSQESAGSALRENEIYLQSIQGRLDKLTASWQSLSNTLLDDGLVKDFVSGATTALDVVNAIVEQLGLMPGLIAAASTVWAQHNNVGKECALLLRVA